MPDPRADASIGDIDLELILQHARDAITVQGADGRLVYANAAAAELMGFPDASALLAAPLATVMASYQLLDEGGRKLRGQGVQREHVAGLRGERINACACGASRA